MNYLNRIRFIRDFIWIQITYQNIHKRLNQMFSSGFEKQWLRLSQQNRYWGFGKTSQQVDDILSSADCTVEKLLDEEGFLDELRNGNSRLLQLQLSPYIPHSLDVNNIAILLDYIVVEPAEDAEDKRAFKQFQFRQSHRYPFYAAEAFTCEVREIIDQFFVETKPASPLESPNKEEVVEAASTQAGKEEVASPEPKEEVPATEEKKEEVPTTEEKKEEAPVTEEKKEEAPATENPTEEKKEEVPTTENSTEEKKEEPVDEPALPIAAPEEAEKQPEEVTKPAETAPPEVEKTEEAPKTSEEHKEVTETSPEKSSEDPQPVEDYEEVLHETPSMEKKSSAHKSRYTLLEKLLSFLSGPVPINPVLAGYFGKVLMSIMEKRKSDLLEYLFHFEGHMDNIIKHSYNKSIAEVLGKLVSNDDRFGFTSGVDEFTEDKKKVLEKMVNKMAPENTPEEITNNCYILCTMIDSKQQLEYFMSEETLKKIFGYAASSNPMALRAALTYLIILYRLKAAPAPAPEPAIFLGFSQPEPESKEEEIPDFDNILKMSVEYISQAKSYLEASNNSPKLDTTYGDNVAPFGLDRLKVIEWMQSLISLKDDSICSKLSELEIPKLMLSLMKRYDMNSVLHLKITKIFEEVMGYDLEAYVEAVYLSISQLIEQFTIKCEIVEWILDLHKESATGRYRSTGKPFNKAFTPFISKLSNKLIELAQNNEKVATYLKSKSAWEEFCNGDLKARNEKENRQLGGGKSKPSIEEDEPAFGNHYKFSSHGGIEVNTTEEKEVQEEDIVDEDGEGEEQVKLSIMPMEKDEKKEDKGIEYEEVTEDVINPEIDAQEKAKLEALDSGKAETHKPQIEYETVEEKVVSPEEPKSPEKTEVPPTEEKPTEAPTVTEQPKVESPEETKPLVENPQEAPVQPIPVEAPLVSEYASNNYWRSTAEPKLEELEADYDQVHVVYYCIRINIIA
eukprot:TRINITY_DN231_c0_g1_i1.p3 TRINITY_DN231_c0_g1~~TRINITY_DN231_c0_g1_i1.p3  ORF type:complete len:960 (-),score=155.17 TRINITY_DN231_c0_g1_i1:21091-23970(-)